MDCFRIASLGARARLVVVALAALALSPAHAGLLVVPGDPTLRDAPAAGITAGPLAGCYHESGGPPFADHVSINFHPGEARPGGCHTSCGITTCWEMQCQSGVPGWWDSVVTSISGTDTCLPVAGNIGGGGGGGPGTDPDGDPGQGSNPWGPCPGCIAYMDQLQQYVDDHMGSDGGDDYGTVVQHFEMLNEHQYISVGGLTAVDMMYTAYDAVVEEVAARRQERAAQTAHQYAYPDGGGGGSSGGPGACGDPGGGGGGGSSGGDSGECN